MLLASTGSYQLWGNDLMILRKWKRLVVLMVLLAGTLFGNSYASGANERLFTSCRDTFSAAPGVGESYSGAVSNDDYGFSAKIPGGLTGWRGVAPGAPYHGFTMFRGDSTSACINIEMHIRVEDDEAPLRPASAKDIKLGMARGFQYVIRSKDGAVPYVNIHTTFTYARKTDGEIDDGDIVLIVPASDLPEWQRLYNAFVESVKFDLYEQAKNVQ
jgi:hypothetical protein